MNQFQKFMSSGFDQALDAFGTVSFVIDGKAYKGDVSEFQARRENDETGIFNPINATIIASVGQFLSCGKSARKLERELVGKLLTCENRTYQIESVRVDSVSVILELTTRPNER